MGDKGYFGTNLKRGRRFPFDGFDVYIPRRGIVRVRRVSCNVIARTSDEISDETSTAIIAIPVKRIRS
jgi:hypothetical protein